MIPNINKIILSQHFYVVDPVNYRPESINEEEDIFKPASTEDTKERKQEYTNRIQDKIKAKFGYPLTNGYYLRRSLTEGGISYYDYYRIVGLEDDTLHYSCRHVLRYDKTNNVVIPSKSKTDYMGSVDLLLADVHWAKWEMITPEMYQKEYNKYMKGNIKEATQSIFKPTTKTETTDRRYEAHLMDYKNALKAAEEFKQKYGDLLNVGDIIKLNLYGIPGIIPHTEYKEVTRVEDIPLLDKNSARYKTMIDFDLSETPGPRVRLRNIKNGKRLIGAPDIIYSYDYLINRYKREFDGKYDAQLTIIRKDSPEYKKLNLR